MSAAGGGPRIVRAPNHVGDVVMALPALEADGADVLVVRPLAPLLAMSGLTGRILPFDRGVPGWLRAVTALRRARYEEGALLTPSFSAAWLLRWGGVARLTGTEGDGRAPLLSRRIPRTSLGGMHRIDQYRLLLGQEPNGRPLSPRLTPRPQDLDAWSRRLGAGTLVGLVPGANAPARRWPVRNFRALASALAKRGARVVVLGGTEEVALAAEVASADARCVDLGGATDLHGLAAALSLCHLVVTNDTGPMHLAGAVGTPTVTLWGPSDPEEVGLSPPRHVGVQGPALPCRPCYKNECGRGGPGTLSSHAHEECMRLITIEQVLEVTLRMLDRAAA